MTGSGVTPGFVLITDRGGHLHNALMLLEGMGAKPQAILTTYGPELSTLGEGGSEVICLPYLFSWLGKRRIWNPVKLVVQSILALYHALRLRPRWVVSTGASDVVPFCYWARCLGAEIYHVECMNQVVTPSLTGRLLYPIVTKLYVQWEELKRCYGPKAEYAGWVL